MYLEKTLTSLEIAEMVGREHKNVMQDIRRIINQLGEGTSPLSYFINNHYKNNQNKEIPCFLLTKKGCELYATRMNGEKGTQFAIKYIERFNEMENELKVANMDSYSIQDPIERAKRWIQEQEEKKALEEQLQLQAPKVVVADAITASSNSILIRDLAKILAQNGAVNVGEKRLFSWMRNNGYLTQKNVPTQRSIEMGIMELHERPVVMKDNQIKTYITPRISGKGQAYFIKKFLYI